MTSKDDGREWDQTVRHLVQAHGADANLIMSRTPTLEQVLFAHLDTHVALEIASVHPPDGHVHPDPLPPGWPEVRPGAYRPFLPSPEALEDPFFTYARTSARPSFTGLPHTGYRPGLIGGAGPAHDAIMQAHLADWAMTVRRNNRARAMGIYSHGVNPPAGVGTDRRTIKRHAAAASARWLATGRRASGQPLAKPAEEEADTAETGHDQSLPPTRMGFPETAQPFPLAPDATRRHGAPSSNAARSRQVPGHRSPRSTN